MQETYVLPIRRSSVEDLGELTGYLENPARWCDVVVVDGSPPPVFAVHHATCAATVTHLAPDPDLRFRMGKVLLLRWGLAGDARRAPIDAAGHRRLRRRRHVREPRVVRTVQAAGGRMVTPLDLYVARVPPTTSHFVGQRVRQAYDEFARPSRLAAFLTPLPAAGWATTRGRWAPLSAATAGTAVLAEVGRRRAGGTAVFPS